MTKYFLIATAGLFFHFSALAQRAQTRETPTLGTCEPIEVETFKAELSEGTRLYSCDRVERLIKAGSGSMQRGYILVAIHSPAGGERASDSRGITVYWKRENKSNAFTLDDLGHRVLGFQFQAPNSRIVPKNYVIDDVNGDGNMDIAIATNTAASGISELYILSVIWSDDERVLKELIPYVQHADGPRAEHNNDGTFIIRNDSPTGALVKVGGEVIVGPSRYLWDGREGKYFLQTQRNPQSTVAPAKKKK